MARFHPKDRRVLAGPITPNEVKEALEDICRSEAFQRSGRLTDLLRYIVTEELENRGARLKAYAIATDVLGRRPDFDPSSDSIVRVEMARLRIALKLYHASVEAPSIVIEVPKGRYRPVFSRAHEGHDPIPTPIEQAVEPPRTLDVDVLAEPSRACPSWTRAVSPAMLLACFIAAVGMGALLVNVRLKEPGARLAPLVLVAPVKMAGAGAQSAGLGLTLQGFLVSEIANDPVFAVGHLADDAQDPSRTAGGNRAVYLLSVSIVADSERWSVSANLQDALSRTVLWSRSETVATGTADSLTWAYELAQRLAAAISDPFGVVARNELAFSTDGPPAARQCLLRLRQWRIAWTEDGLRRFADCAVRLQDSREGESATALALMARGNYVAARWLGEPERGQKLEMAFRQIARAQAIEPQLYIVESTAIRLAACRGDAAAVERMLRSFVNRRPNNPKAMMEAAFLYAYMLNDLPAADRLREQGGGLALHQQPNDVLAPALRAFRKGDMAEVVTRLKQSSNPVRPADNVLWLAASAALSDAAAFRSAMGRLAESGHRTPEAIIGIVANSCWNDQVKNDLTAALRTAFAANGDRPL